ncbi:MAG: PQQ-dependent sugar dehydrogenase, partial [Verrucomicrobiota bacterium]
MKTKTSLLLVMGICLCHTMAFGQPSGLSNRVANSTLQMPANPPVFGYAVTNAFGSLTFTDPVAIATPPGETNRLFVVEQRGRIAVITNLANPTRTVFLDITNRVLGGVPSDERGLLGFAFHPNHASNRRFYVWYCVNSNSPGVTNMLHDRLSQFQTLTNNPNLADTNSEVILINQYDEAGNHNGGDLHFGPDGYLYISLGDEGGANDQYNNSQRIDKKFFAGMLRIDVDKKFGNPPPNPHPSIITNAGGANYSVPSDNPFIGATQFNGTNLNPANVRTEFWATGLRNPWRFSFDSANGTLFCGDVGQGAREEIDIITKGGNYGWVYREGFIAGPKTAPIGFAHLNPILDYGRGTGTNQGIAVTGGVVYRGAQISQLYGAYIYSDYSSGNIWATRPNGTNVVPFERLTGNIHIAGFGSDPRNGDVLMADQNLDTIRRLVYSTNVSGTPLPATLIGTGAFADVATLTTNPGIVPYEVNVPFWSDNAKKTRWFSVPNTNLTIAFNRTNNWQFPTGTVWIKHFDLELTNGVPASAKRLETRLIVKNSNGIYGVTYRWGNSLTNATLVPEEGMDEAFAINDGGNMRTQVWHYPSRSECLTCHTPVAGLALGFNTAQLNRDFDYSGITDNQILALNHVGYFSSSLSNLNTLPALAHATNSAVSTEYRVRSYLAANCVQCHQPGGSALGTWDARVTNPLSASGILNGGLINNLGDTNNRVIVPNDLTHSVLLTRISISGSSRMPPLASSLIDTQAVNLVSAWITNALANYQTYPQWQLAKFGSTNAPLTGATEDFDGDRSLNYQEYLLT